MANYKLDNVKQLNRLSFLLSVFAVFIIICSSIYYIVANWFRIEQIIIEGDTVHITKEQLSYIANNRLQGTFFTLDIDRLKHEFKQIPWVRSVTVIREFPDTITVNLKEYDVIARFGEDGLISGSGKVFNGADDNPNLPIFIANHHQIPNLLVDYNLLKPLLDEKNIKLAKLEIVGSSITKVYFSNNLQITICSLDIGNQLRLLQKYWDRLYTINSNLQYVNMCYKNKMAINMPDKIKESV